MGIEDGYDGIINNRYRPLGYEDVSGILTLGAQYWILLKLIEDGKFGYMVGVRNNLLAMVRLEEMPQRASVIIEGRTVQIRPCKYEVEGVGGFKVPVFFWMWTFPTIRNGTGR
jgi:6-phosphofructokinase